MKKLCLILCTALLLALCACSRESVQKLPTQVEQERSIARFTSQQELRYYLEDHAALAGNLPAFCEATKNGVPEKLQAGAEILEKGREQFAAYLFVRLEHMPEDAFADDAAWTLSDTPRGNLLLQGPEVRLIYNAEEDEVHPPRRAEVDEDNLATLKIRYEQASVPPGFDWDSAATAAFLAYLKGNPTVFQDDGVSVFEDTAWLIRYSDINNQIPQLCFLRENTFCGLSKCSLLFADSENELYIQEATCLDEGWFLDEDTEDYLQRRIQIAAGKYFHEEQAGTVLSYLDEASARFVPRTRWDSPTEWDIAEDAKSAVWLTQWLKDGSWRFLLLLPFDTRYDTMDPDAAAIPVRQFCLTMEGEVWGNPGCALQREVMQSSLDTNSIVYNSAGKKLSLYCPLWSLSPDVWMGFHETTLCAQRTQADLDTFGDSWRTYTDGRIEVCVADETMPISHIHLLTEPEESGPSWNWYSMSTGETEQRFLQTLDISGVRRQTFLDERRLQCAAFGVTWTVVDDIVTQIDLYVTV